MIPEKNGGSELCLFMAPVLPQQCRKDFILLKECSPRNSARLISIGLIPIIVLISRLPIPRFQKGKRNYKAVGCLVFTMFIAVTIHILFISIKPAVLIMAH